MVISGIYDLAIYDLEIYQIHHNVVDRYIVDSDFVSSSHRQRASDPTRCTPPTHRSIPPDERTQSSLPSSSRLPWSLISNSSVSTRVNAGCRPVASASR